MLSTLNKAAASTSARYIKFDELEPGTYQVNNFSLIDSKFGKGKKCVSIDISGGYVILPNKMTKCLNNEKKIAQLNKESYDFIYEGKDESPPYSIKFRFQMHNAKKVAEHNDDQNEATVSDEDTAEPPNKKQKISNDNDSITI